MVQEERSPNSRWQNTASVWYKHLHIRHSKFILALEPYKPKVMESIFYIYNCPDLLYNSEYMKCPIYFHLSHPIYFQLPKATRISPKYPNLLSFPKSLHFTQIIQFYSSRYHFQNYIIYPIYPYYPNFHIFNPNYST